MEFPILSTLIFLPIILCVFVLFSQNNKQAKLTAVIISLINLGLSIYMALSFNNTATQMQFVEKSPWIDLFNVSYYLGIDGISLSLILLTTLLTTLAILFSKSGIEKSKTYFVSFLALSGLSIGVFASLDAMVFYVFFEAILIPMFIIIGVWGGEKRIYATFKFFLYTLFGSLFFLVALIYMYLHFGTFDMLVWQNGSGELSFDEQKLLFAAMFIAFAIKVPMAGFHTWLPDAHVQAPTSGSVILAGVLLKLGTYAMLRFSLPMFPEAAQYFAIFIMAWSVVAIIYASMLAFYQKDIKKMIAYSSIAHMGFITLGIFAFNYTAMQASIMQMINHGLVSAGLFFAIGCIYNRLHTRNIDNLGALTTLMPKYAFIFMILTLASVGLPSTANFIGEINILMGSFASAKVLTSLAILGVLLGACYMLKLYKAVFFDKPLNENKDLATVKDLTIKEQIVFAPLVILIFVLGLKPNLMFDMTDVASKTIIEFIK